MTAQPTGRSVAHGVFTIERTYPSVTPQRVFEAFATEEERLVLGPNEAWDIVERKFDFRVGGRERLKGQWRSGLVTQFDATYFDIIPGERIVYAYEMLLDGRKISVSLATFEFKPGGARAHHHDRARRIPRRLRRQRQPRARQPRDLESSAPTWRADASVPGGVSGEDINLKEEFSGSYRAANPRATSNASDRKGSLALYMCAGRRYWPRLSGRHAGAGVQRRSNFVSDGPGF